MSRARSSLSSIPSLLHRRMSSRSRDGESAPSTPSERPAPTPQIERLRHRHTTSTGYERSPYLPRVQVPPELDLGFEELSGTTSNVSSNSPLPRLSAARRDGRASSMLPSFRTDRGLRNMTNSLRRRRSPIRREEDQAAMLSRLLSVAAAATAASLMGDDHRAVSEARNVAGDGEDGTFDSFLQALQNGRIASALRQSGNSNGNEEGTDTPGGNAQPLNFFRMFRFGTSHGNEQSDADTADRDGRAENNGEDEEGDGRMVPIIIVGIRSINPGSGTERDDNIPPFLDALSSFPTPATSPGEEPMEGWTRQPPNTTRFSHRRRASMGGMNNFSSSYDNQRYRSARPSPWSTVSDSPAGPLPPPSTPASAGLSAVSSGATTPTFTASPPSPAIPSSASSRRGSFIRRPTASGLGPTTEEPTVHRRTPRQRRLSESDFTRFGSGSSRRNGVVEPDNNPGEGSRSWIIYVLGGSYPENHPILTTPSLFTDSPTYEDMLLLSTLLGPAKPPVASEEDVAAAPGLHVIRTHDNGRLVAEAEGGLIHTDLMAEARCLVCLCEFEAEEEARKLVKCGHLFHRTCIDQWLITGRNSCPLCRAPGVEEKPASSLQVTTPDPDSGLANDSAQAAA
ncbi:hypothetical protein P171DRAFT_372634 [Karstenula rhodostoma CBS 690.94]|uniref:RING-type domain-containing protein n=1 Tax=Karstenula rhodostoma CBS 690.94 TaxID=1392251 RepID=A0A9P4P7G0_9PLEO|nr:hypothetical protein P171DRAFT_372634 [Karstenula rhodostoma CBS 690.94]